MTVLIAEDNVDNYELLKRRLERLGIQTLWAQNGREAVDLGIQHLPQLILMDIAMPEMSGIDATKALREDARTRSIPIIAVTAHADTFDRIRCLKAGCDAFAIKPINFSDLYGVMNDLMRSGRPSAMAS